MADNAPLSWEEKMASIDPWKKKMDSINPWAGRDLRQEKVDQYKADGGGAWNSVKRGALRVNQSFNAAGAGLGDVVMGAMPESIQQSDIGKWLQGQADEDKQDVIRDSRTLQSMPNHPTTVNMTNRANQEDTFLGGLSVIADEFIQSPDKAGWFVDTMAEQIPVMAAMAVGTKGAGNLLGTATKAATAGTFGIGSGVGSMATTFGSNVAEAMGEDVSKFDDAMEYAFTRSLAQGIVDGTVGAFVPFKIGGLHKINVPTQALLQAVGGAGGEAAGAAAVGQEVKTGDLLMEGLLELLSAPADVVMARMESLNPQVEEEKPWFKPKPVQPGPVSPPANPSATAAGAGAAGAGLTGANKFNDPTTITGPAANKPQKTAADFKDRQAPEVASLIFHRKLHDKQEDGEKQYGAAIARIQAVADTAASSGRTDVKDEALKVIKWLDDEQKKLPFYAPEDKGILKAENSLLAKLKAPGKAAANPDAAPTKPTVGATAAAEEQPAGTDDEEKDIDKWANSVLAGEGEPAPTVTTELPQGKPTVIPEAPKTEAPKNPRGDIKFVDVTPNGEQKTPIGEPTPPPEPGMVRYYHGGKPDDVTGKLHFTSDIRNAKGWAERNPDMHVSYVDVAENDPIRGGDEEYGVLPPQNVELPAEIASKRKPLNETPAKPESEIGKSAKSNAETPPVTGTTPEATPQPTARSQEVSDLYEGLASRAEAAGAPTLAKDIRKGLNTFGDTDEQARSRAETFEAIVKNKEARIKKGQAALKQPAKQEPAAAPVEPKESASDRLTYKQFKDQMQGLLSKSVEYTQNQAGSGIYAEKMAELSDKYPDYSERLDAESNKPEPKAETEPDKAPPSSQTIVENYPEVAGAIQKAMEAGVTEEEVSKALKSLGTDGNYDKTPTELSRFVNLLTRLTVSRLQKNKPGKPLSEIEITMEFTDEKGEHSTIKGNAEKLLSLMDKRIDTYKRLWECVTK